SLTAVFDRRRFSYRLRHLTQRTLPVFAAVRISSEFTGNSHLKTRLGHSFARNPGQQGGNTGHAFGVARRVQLSCVHLKGGANRGECIRGDGDFSSVTPGMDCSSAA
ncbi:hypothetical protein, partial [Mycobacterium tuberculosis]|uniref:hypothetical protein n=3 Tax=Mycobacterium tuberculosis TaxID=1773 RepID=UPI0019D4B581